MAITSWTSADMEWTAESGAHQALGCPGYEYYDALRLALKERRQALGLAVTDTFFTAEMGHLYRIDKNWRSDWDGFFDDLFDDAAATWNKCHGFVDRESAFGDDTDAVNYWTLATLLDAENWPTTGWIRYPSRLGSATYGSAAHGDMKIWEWLVQRYQVLNRLTMVWAGGGSGHISTEDRADRRGWGSEENSWGEAVQSCNLDWYGASWDTGGLSGNGRFGGESGGERDDQDIFSASCQCTRAKLQVSDLPELKKATTFYLKLQAMYGKEFLTDEVAEAGKYLACQTAGPDTDTEHEQGSYMFGSQPTWCAAPPRSSWNARDSWLRWGSDWFPTYDCGALSDYAMADGFAFRAA